MASGLVSELLYLPLYFSEDAETDDVDATFPCSSYASTDWS